MIKNYYKVLQVHPDAEVEIIDAAYKRLAQKYHPDINKDELSSSLMAEINEAHQILKNSQSRKEYDAKRKAYLKERKKEKLASQNAEGKAPVSSTWLQNLALWCNFSAIQRNWMLSETKKTEQTENLKFQKFINDVQEFYKLSGYKVLQTLQRSSSEVDVVVESMKNAKMYVAHVDFDKTEINIEKVYKFKAEIQKANFTQGAFITTGRFSKLVLQWANSNSNMVKLVDYQSFIKILAEARQKANK